MKVLLALAVVVASAVAQAPKPCVSPPQWEGRIMRIDPSQKFMVRGKYSYDSINERTRHIDEIELSGDKREFFDVVEIFSEKKRYIYNIILKNCSVEAMRPDEVFRKVEIPDDAKSSGAAVVGSTSIPNAGLNVDMWYGETQHDGHTGKYFGTWTMEGCLPISDYYFSDRIGMVHTSIYDITTGISDPNVFIPEFACFKP